MWFSDDNNMIDTNNIKVFVVTEKESKIQFQTIQTAKLLNRFSETQSKGDHKWNIPIE